MSEDKIPRLALASWGHSWLTRNDARQGEYRHLSHCLDELAERGYNALKVDAFPHLIAAHGDGVVIDRYELHPPGLAPVQVRPRHGLLELAAQARARGIRLWLSSRFLSDSQSRRSFVRRPQDFIDVWSQTLELLRRQGLLETVVAVDFCHHFPMPPAAHGAARHIFGANPLNRLSRLGLWTRGVEQRVERYLLEVPRSLRALFPEVAFGVSMGLASERHVHMLDTSELDFLDGHLWLDDDPGFVLASGGLLKRAVGDRGAWVQERVAGMAWRAGREQWQRSLQGRLSRHYDFARVRRMQAVVGGGFVHLTNEQSADWGWVQEVSEFAVEAALNCGVQALCPTVQARPHSQGLWQDVAWQQAINRRILSR